MYINNTQVYILYDSVTFFAWNFNRLGDCCALETKWFLVHRRRCQNKRGWQFRIIYGNEYRPDLCQVFNKYKEHTYRTAASLFATDNGASLNLAVPGKKQKRKNTSKDVLTGALSQDRKIPTFLEKGRGRGGGRVTVLEFLETFFFHFFPHFFPIFFSLWSVMNDRVGMWLVAHYSHRNNRITIKYAFIKKCITLCTGI